MAEILRSGGARVQRFSAKFAGWLKRWETGSLNIYEADGRWIAEVLDLPGVLAYGATPEEAKAKVQALALRVVADRLEHGEEGPDLLSISFAAA